MAKYKVALIEVFSADVMAEITSCVPEEFELVATKTHDEQEKIAVATGADFILVGGVPLSAAVIAAAPKARLIQKWGIGVDKIDLKAAAARGIPVAITAGANSTPVAEHAIALMLAVYRRIPYVDRKLRQGIWLKSENRSVSYQINGKTVGIVGFGNIARQVARRVRAFNAKVIYYDTVRPSPEVEAELGASYRPLNELLAQADIITLHTPLTPETRNLIDARAFSLMKPTAIVINTSRGPVIDELALVDALKTGKIMAAGLDTFAKEPAEAGNPLFELENVVVTPHIAGGVMDNVANQARHCFGNMQKVLKGEPLSPADVIQS